jgi:hypothetical protein
MEAGEGLHAEGSGEEALPLPWGGSPPPAGAPGAEPPGGVASPEETMVNARGGRDARRVGQAGAPC